MRLGRIELKRYPRVKLVDGSSESVIRFLFQMQERMGGKRGNLIYGVLAEDGQPLGHTEVQLPSLAETSDKDRAEV